MNIGKSRDASRRSDADTIAGMLAKVGGRNSRYASSRTRDAAVAPAAAGMRASIVMIKTGGTPEAYSFLEFHEKSFKRRNIRDILTKAE